MNDEGPDRLYIVVRADLSPGQQLAQSTHAAFQFWAEFPHLVEPWFRESNYLVVVTAEDEDALQVFADTVLELDEIHYTIVTEPDLDGSWTAIALQPGETARLMCSCMPLALKYAEEPKLVDNFY